MALALTQSRIAFACYGLVNLNNVVTTGITTYTPHTSTSSFSSNDPSLGHHKAKNASPDNHHHHQHANDKDSSRPSNDGDRAREERELVSSSLSSLGSSVTPISYVTDANPLSLKKLATQVEVHQQVSRQKQGVVRSLELLEGRSIYRRIEVIVLRVLRVIRVVSLS